MSPDFATEKRVIKAPRPAQLADFFTIGYEQSEMPLFLKLLRSREVQVVVDVRAVPLSRKPGFSKNALSASLEAAGIDYLHVVRLGAPKQLRDALRATGSWWNYVKGYTTLLMSRTAEVDELVTLAARRRICLLCFERDSAQCHRSLIAREMEMRSCGLKLTVDHIKY
jgi:uncharacterized protein (DUF488 family)